MKANRIFIDSSLYKKGALSVTEHDFFHADVHAGNLLVLEDGRVGFIDFGIVGKISDKVKAMESISYNKLLNFDCKLPKKGVGGHKFFNQMLY
jgi:predicted unusual protein kinase regulating ubiquinone biosynthesis (AarF/ABC1/UbiB family)